jgi:hypothetical protein
MFAKWPALGILAYVQFRVIFTPIRSTTFDNFSQVTPYVRSPVDAGRTWR